MSKPLSSKCIITDSITGHAEDGWKGADFVVDAEAYAIEYDDPWSKPLQDKQAETVTSAPLDRTSSSGKETPMDYTPSQELVEILRPAYAPCGGFDGTCKDIAKWRPDEGHVPRGFVGALGDVKEVEVVILVAEPGNPHPNEAYRSSNKLDETCEYTFNVLNEGTDLFHRNLKYLLDRLFPGIPLKDQLRKAWVTESYLCSAPKETGPVLTDAENECASRYLTRQLELLNGLPVIALGGKAHKRVSRVPDVRNLKKAYSVAPPGCNHKPARPSWDAAAEWARDITRRRKGDTKMSTSRSRISRVLGN